MAELLIIVSGFLEQYLWQPCDHSLVQKRQLLPYLQPKKIALAVATR